MSEWLSIACERGTVVRGLKFAVVVGTILITINHGDASILGFCDGHAEKRKWRDPYTIERVDKLTTQNVDTYGRQAPPAGQFLDIQYMAQGWAYEHKL